MKSAPGDFDLRRWLPGLLISAVAIFIIIQLVSWEELGQAFATIRLQYLIPGIVLVLLWLILRAVALKVILGGRPTVVQAFRAINIGYLLNNILPLRAGEIGKAVVLGKSSKLGASFVLSGIVIERAFDLVFAASLLLLALPFVLAMDWARPLAFTVLLIVLAGLVALYLVARNHAWIQEQLNRLSERSNLVRRYVLPQLTNFFAGLQILTDLKRFLLSLMMIGSSWLVAVLLYYVMLFSIASAPSIWWGLFINSILALGIALPSAPAALGVFEASLVAALKVLGISYSYALAYAVMMHFLQFAITGLLGVYGLAKEKQSIGNLIAIKKKSFTSHLEESTGMEEPE